MRPYRAGAADDRLVGQKISAVPVLSLRGRVLGVVTETELLRKEELKRDPDGRHGIHLNYRARRDLVTAETAGEIMSTAPLTIRPDATVAEAARQMDRHAITCLPVTDENGALLGVVGVIDVEGELRYAFDDTKALHAPERDESPMTRGTHPPVASRRLT